MLVAALVILAGVVVVASGRGGEMAYEHPDYPPLDLGPVSAADVALLRPPSAAWGYNMRVTDEALNTIARAMSERDIRISSLEQEIDDLRGELSRGGSPWPGARHAARDRDRDHPQDTFEELPVPAWPPAREEPSEPVTRQERQEEEPPQTGLDDTVADESIPAVTDDDLPRQTPAGDQADEDEAPHDAVIHQAAGQPRHGEETSE